MKNVLVENYLNINDPSTLNEANLFRWLKDKFKHGIDKVKSNFIKEGYFYNFKYQAKGYEEGTLSYFDEAPTILVLNEDSNYILGLNFNYLPIPVKIRTVNKLKNRYPKQFDEDKPLPNVQWKHIKKELEKTDWMIHRYLKNRVSQIVRVKNKDMVLVALIDLSNFIGISLTKLWNKMKKHYGVKMITSL